MLKQTVAIVAILVSVMTATAAMQQAPAAVTPPRASGPKTMLKLTIVLSRFEGERKIGSLPYTLTVATDERATLRMGSEVPMVVTIAGGGDKPQQTSYNYRQIGTNIDCIAGGLQEGGSYRISLTIEDSSVHVAPAQKPAIAAQQPDVPSYRTFRSNYTVLLRDGQTMQNTTAADPVTGEVMKVDVTLNVMK